MGGGSSAAKAKTTKKSFLTRSSSGLCVSSSSSKEFISDDEPASSVKGNPFHAQNCRDTDFHRFNTIREAYAFDETNKKSVSKKERVYGCTERGVQNWGSATVNRRGVLKIHCDACGVFVVDRAGREPFYTCVRCRNAGKKLNLCTGCFEMGRLGGERETRSTQASRMSSPGEPQPVYSSRGSGDRIPSKTSSFSDSASTPRGQPAVPSGRWEATLIEQKRPRKEIRDLTFTADGRLRGSGPENCQVSGVYSNTSRTVVWTETYAWGKLDVNGKFASTRKISGMFTTSDGGKGTIELICNP